MRIVSCTLAALVLFAVTQLWLSRSAFPEEILEPERQAKSEEGSSERLNRAQDMVQGGATAQAPSLLGDPQEEQSEVALEPVLAARPAATPAFEGTTNILLVGIDRRPGVTRGGLPDTIVVAVLSPETGHLGLISVPRDLYVSIPDHGEDRINASFAAAWNQKKKPLEVLASVVSDTLLLPIHHSAAIDLTGFETLVDALGGIEVIVPCAIDDNFLDPRTESGRRLLSLDAGKQQMDGATALLYARSRHGRSDFSRARRQQAILWGMKKQFTSIDGLSRLPEFWEELSKVVVSDLSRGDFLRLIRQAMKIRSEKIHGFVMGEKEAVPHRSEEGKAVLLPQPTAIQAALRELFSRGAPGVMPQGAACKARDVALRR